jgi:D-alanyl-D-alanine carboxypeptidase/D-alanyl-D-alanine-endopeptidase (penicillin-binding protein 4)
VPSPTVAQLLGLMLPPSDNFFAETLLKDLGALYGSGGTTARGSSVVAQAIASTFGFTPRIVDGSGLSRADRTSPFQVVSMLAALNGTPTGQVLRESLAVAGKTGTLEKRMRHTAADGRCQGKTGTLTGASNLVGYCQSAGGHLLAFAIFNDGISTTAAHIFQDHMTISIASSQITSAELARARRAGSRSP